MFMLNRAAVLTVAGSDSGGGAGIQADLKAFRALDVFGTSVVTCITAQNPDEVRHVEPVSPEGVVLQLRTVCEGFPIAAAKTGMLFSADIVCAVAQVLADHPVPHLVIDPVMISTSGSCLLKEDAVDALTSTLIPLADVITPNLPEAEVLCGRGLSTVSDMEGASREIASRYGVACVIKGGHAPADMGTIVDVLCVNGDVHRHPVARIAAKETHGTGCTFSAALVALLAKGQSLLQAVPGAQAFVGNALRNAVAVGKHSPLSP